VSLATTPPEPPPSRAAVEPPPAVAPPIGEAPPPHDGARAPAAALRPAEDDRVEDLDADLDADGASDSYESLVALVASLPDDAVDAPSSAGPREAARPPEEADEVEVVDLDDDDAGEAVERLIAQAIVGAPAEEKPEEADETPVIDLDDDERPRPPRGGATGSTPTASAEAALLAQAAARGATVESPVPTFFLDTGEVSTPEQRARLLAQTLAHAEHKEARYRVPIDTGVARRWKGSLAAVGFLLAGWVAAVPPTWVRPEPPAELNAAARARGIRTALLLQALQVEAFRVETQRLPGTLDELPMRLPGVQYARSGTRAYQLVGYEADGNAIVYDSARPAPAFGVLLSALWLAGDNP
jgi:hypothetical protein